MIHAQWLLFLFYRLLKLKCINLGNFAFTVFAEIDAVGCLAEEAARV